MADYKITFFIEGVQSATLGASAALGWTETFYLGGTDAATLDAALQHPDVLRYVALRRTCLPTSYRVAFIRAQVAAVPRNFKVAAPVAQFGQASVGPGLKPGQVQCALLVDLVRLPQTGVAGEPTHHRKFLLRALPSNVILGNVLDPTGASFPAIQSFLDFIAGHATGTPAPAPGAQATNLGLRFHDPNFVFQPVTSIKATPSGVNPSYTIDVVPQVTAPVGNAPPTVWEIRDVPNVGGLPRFNRVWTWQNQNAGPPMSSTLGRTRKPLGLDTYSGPGPARIRQVMWLYGRFSQYTIIGLRNKRTGRIFRQLRGRSSSRT